MQEILRVHRLQRVEQRTRDAVEFVLRGRAAETLEPSFEALALLEAHDHVGGGVRLEHAGDTHDAWMVEAGQHARFLHEARSAPVERLLVALGLRPDAHAGVAIAEIEGIVFLQRDLGVESDVLGLVGDAEAAGAEHAHDTVGAIEQRIHRQHQAAVQGTLRASLPQVSKLWCAPTCTLGHALPALGPRLAPTSC